MKEKALVRIIKGRNRNERHQEMDYIRLKWLHVGRIH